MADAARSQTKKQDLSDIICWATRRYRLRPKQANGAEGYTIVVSSFLLCYYECYLQRGSRL